MRRGFLSGISLSVFVCTANAAAQAPSTAPLAGDAQPAKHIRVNEYTFSAQAEAALAADSQSNVCVVWSSRRQQDGRSGIYMRRYSPQGHTLLNETAVNLFTRAHATSPAIACGPNNEVWIVWKSHGQDGSAGAIIARQFNFRDGLVTGSNEILINEQTAGDQDLPLVSVSRQGIAAVVWMTVGEDSRSSARLRLFNDALQPMTGEIPIPHPDAAGTRSVALEWGNSGDLAILAAVIDQDGMAAGLQMHRFDSRGVLLATQRNFGAQLAARELSHRGMLPMHWPSCLTQDNSIASAKTVQIEPAFAATADGYLAAWLEPVAIDSADYCVIVQRFDHRGLPLSQPVGVSRTLAGMQNAPALARANGSATVAWNQWEGTGVEARSQISLHRVAFDDDAASFLEISEPPSARTKKQTMRAAAATQRLVFAPNGALLCTWSGNAGLGDETGAYLSVWGNGPWSTEQVIVAKATEPASPPESSEIAAPHEPPTFEPLRIEPAQREFREGSNEFGFTAITATGWSPPDPHMGVGPDHIVVMTNGAIAFFTKAGQLQFQMSINGPGGFWGPAGAQASLVFDPEVFYDELSGRFFAIAGEGNAPGGRSYALLAISDDSNPNGTWHKYRFETTAWAGAVYDSINLGVDANVVYISGDAAGSAVVHPVLTFDKAPLLAGIAPVMHVTLMPTTIESAGLPPVSFDNPPATYFIEHTELTTNTTVRLYALTNPLSTPSFVSTNLTVPAYGPPELVPQAGTSVKFQTFDARFWSVAHRNGSLWATHHINSDRCLARWYEIAMNGWPSSGQQPSLVQWGNIDPGPGIRTFFSAITVDDAGNAAMVFARSSPTEFPSMATAYRAHSDAPGTFQPSEIRKSSNAPWTANDRWGDYAAIAIDPVDGFTVWAHHEYAVSNNWLTWVQRFTPVSPAPSNDLCINASLVGAGAHPFSTVAASTDGPNETAACSFNGNSNLLNDVWFKLLTNCTGTATVNVCGADFDTKIAVYGGCPSGPGEAIACDDNFCGDDAHITFPVTTNTVYRIRIGSPNATSGSGVLMIDCTGSPPLCPADISPVGGDGQVNVSDLLLLINAWGACPAPPATCAADIAPPGGDGAVNVADLLTLINAWGACP